MTCRPYKRAFNQFRSKETKHFLIPLEKYINMHKMMILYVFLHADTGVLLHFLLQI